MLATILIAVSATSFDVTSHSQWKHWQCEGEAMGAKYVNYAKGFSVVAPAPYAFRRPVQTGPEVGASFPLTSDCEAVVVVFGEANSLEWANLKAVAAWNLSVARDGDPAAVISASRARLGRLPAIVTLVRHTGTGDIEHFVRAFRPGGALVYTAHLATTATRYKRDLKAFNATLRSFRLERWE